MSKTGRVNTKTPKKRATVTGDLVGVRVQPEMAKQLDDWRREQEDLPGRPEAIRRLVEIGLSKPALNEPRVLSTAQQGAARAAELAVDTIDNRMDPTASQEDRKVRKRKLVEGPSAFETLTRTRNEATADQSDLHNPRR
jgi:hypothetical protein